MADYINKNILSQAYIHIEPVDLDTNEKLNNFKEHISAFSKSRADFFLYPNISIKIEFEEGSLKARITFMGTVALLMQGVSSYPDFREGVSLIYNDSKRLAEYIISEVQFSSGAKHGDVIRLEARTGVVGSLHKINSELEQIKKGADGKILAEELIIKLDQVYEEIESLVHNIQEQEDLKLIKNGLANIVVELPKNPKPPKEKTNSHIAILDYQRKRKNLRNFFGLD